MSLSYPTNEGPALDSEHFSVSISFYSNKLSSNQISTTAYVYKTSMTMDWVFIMDIVRLYIKL